MAKARKISGNSLQRCSEKGGGVGSNDETLYQEGGGGSNCNTNPKFRWSWGCKDAQWRDECAHESNPPSF